MNYVLNLAKRYPFKFGLLYSGIKTQACDLLVQKVIEGREEIDWKRNVAFAAFGFAYLGGVQYMLYVPGMKYMFPRAADFAGKPIMEKLRDWRGMRDLCSQVFLDQCIHHPLIYFPAFYIMKDAITSDKPAPWKALQKYWGNINEDLSALWKIWVPSTFINFGFMPMHLRIPWVATTSLAWTVILSTMRGGSDKVPNAGTIIGPHPDSISLELFMRTVLPPPELDPNNAHVLITVHGPDRPGMVAAVSRGVYEAGGNLTTGKMIKLGREFAVMMHVECPLDQVPQMRENLHARKAQGPLSGCDVQTRQVVVIGSSGEGSTGNSEATALSKRPVYTASVRLTGPDQPGLLMKLTEMLASHGLNVEHIQTEQHVQPSDPRKPRLFSCSGLVTSVEEPDHGRIQEGIRKLRAELRGVTCVIEREA